MAPDDRASLSPIRTYKQFFSNYVLKKRLRYKLRDAAIFGLSLTRSIPADKNWIRFPYYHHVFDDERMGFENQLKYFKNHGELISMDDAVTMLESEDPIDGRYFSISFDDGYLNNLTNATPILVEQNATAIFFALTERVRAASESGPAIIDRGFPGREVVIEFLGWDDLREMSLAGMAIGSHTVSHPRLSELSEEDIERELRQSKEEIEAELGRPCHHFSPPEGRPGRDFIVDRDPAIAGKVGYRSFVTSIRGSAAGSNDPMALKRDWTLAGWGGYQLRYFFSR